MRCRMCGRTVHGVKGPDQGMMKKEVFERLAEIFSPGGSLALFGRGETLMHPDFPYILKLAKEKEMKVTFNSNGKGLDRKNCSSGWLNMDRIQLRYPVVRESLKITKKFIAGANGIQLWGKYSLPAKTEGAVWVRQTLKFTLNLFRRWIISASYPDSSDGPIKYKTDRCYSY